MQVVDFHDNSGYGRIYLTQGIWFFGVQRQLDHLPGGFGFRSAFLTAAFQSPCIFNRSGSGPDGGRCLALPLAFLCLIASTPCRLIAFRLRLARLKKCACRHSRNAHSTENQIRLHNDAGVSY